MEKKTTNIIKENKSRIDEIHEEIEREEKDLIELRGLVSKIKEQIVDAEPAHFSKNEILKITFGSLAIGFAIIFREALVDVAINLDLIHIEMIILTTMILLIAEIYFVWFNMVKDKAKRKLGEFLTKRLITLYFVAVLSSFFLIYIFNIDKNISSFSDVMKLVVMMTMPCSVGAAIPSMLKKY